MAPNPSKVSKIVNAALDAQRDIDTFTTDDALTAASGIAADATKPCYVAGPEVVLPFTVSRAAAGTLTAATPVSLGTLAAPVRPQTAQSIVAVVQASGSTVGTGAFAIGTDGVVTFTPDANLASTANLTFKPFATSRWLLAGAFSDDVA